MEEFRQAFSGIDPDLMPANAQQDDAGTAVEFYWNEVAQQHFCRMHFAGNKLTKWDQPVRLQDKRRFARQWDLYERGLSQDGGQTQLSAWGAIDPGSIEMYTAMNVRTVEQLAAVNDVHFQEFPPGQSHLAVRHREMAQKFVREKQESAHFNEAMDAAEQAKAVAEQALADKQALEARLAELEAKQADTFPKHAGGPYYLLSDGTKVKGKGKAIEAEKALAA